MTTGSNRFAEPEKSLFVTDADVVVCGGGPAGVAAAISAARSGARTVLFDASGCLGGVWTAGLLTYIFDFEKPGLTREIRERLDARDARRGENIERFVYEPEEMKIILEEMCCEAGVIFLYETRVVAAYRERRRLTTVVTESRSGRRAWTARVFIDATGDGAVGSLAGCGWSQGRPTDSASQPLTMNALVVVPKVGLLKDYISFFEDDSMEDHVRISRRFLSEILRAGITPSYGMPTLFHVRDNLVMAMMNHEYGVDPFDADAMTRATVRARAEVHRIVRALVELGGIWEGLRLVATAERIGIREGRRIHGRATVTEADLREGASFPDAVTKVRFGVDIHAPTSDENESRTIDNGAFRSRPYDIPLGALIARDVDGLMMAGRCISGDFIAHASYRVTGDAVAMGEAAGAVAAHAARSGRMPHEVAWENVARDPSTR